ncbi:MAG: hypothetical protein ACK4UJ_04795 [Leptonema sp. (in: bacteria)]
MKIIKLFLLFFFLVSCKQGRDGLFDQEDSKKEFIYCEFQKDKDCNFSLQENNQILFSGKIDLNPKPVRVMKEITFTIELNQYEFDPEEILLDLTMPEMYMGENKVILKKNQKNVYEGKGVLPECSSNFTRWNIEIFFNNRKSTNIQFDILSK